jgi:hypothetical protein
LEKLCEIQDLVLFKGWEAFVDSPWPLDETSNDAHTPHLERSFWGHSLHLHGSFFFFLFEFTIDLILEVLSLAGADRAVILFPFVVVNLSGRKSGNSRYPESI